MLEAVGFNQLLACALRVVSGRFAAFSARGATKRATRITATPFERTLPRRNFSIWSNNRSLSLACMAHVMTGPMASAALSTGPFVVSAEALAQR
jgi:hypothetical protein